MIKAFHINHQRLIHWIGFSWSVMATGAVLTGLMACGGFSAEPRGFADGRSTEQRVPQHRLHQRVEDHRPLPGGYSPVASDDVRIQRAAGFALDGINRSRVGSQHDFKIVEIKNASLQVVAGLNLAFTMILRAGPLSEVHKIVVYQALDGSLTVTQDDILSRTETTRH